MHCGVQTLHAPCARRRRDVAVALLGMLLMNISYTRRGIRVLHSRTEILMGKEFCLFGVGLITEHCWLSRTPHTRKVSGSIPGGDTRRTTFCLRPRRRDAARPAPSIFALKTSFAWNVRPPARTENPTHVQGRRYTQEGKFLSSRFIKVVVLLTLRLQEHAGRAASFQR